MECAAKIRAKVIHLFRQALKKKMVSEVERNPSLNGE